MNRARLRELGFELGARAEAGVSDEGAWFATAPDGAPVVLKWFPDETAAERYAVLLPGLDELRSRGVPVPEYPHVLAVDGWTLSAQQILPGTSVRNPSPAMVERVVECVAAMRGRGCLRCPSRDPAEPYPGGVELAVPDPPLSDGVVALRVPSQQDLPAIERRIVDPAIVRWMGPSDHTARELLELNLTRWTRGTRATLSVCDPNDACLGHVWVELDAADPHRGSVGYWLLPEARGKGFATRSVQLVSRWAFGELRMARLSLSIEPSNDRSQGVAKRSGFVKEGVLRSYEEIGDRRVDCVLFSLVPADLGWGETR